MPELTWRWVTKPIDGNPDNCNNVLVEGEGPLPGPRVILECGNIDAEDADLIRAAPKLYAELTLVEKYLRFMDDWGDLGDGGRVRLEGIRSALTAARGEGEPDA